MSPWLVLMVTSMALILPSSPRPVRGQQPPGLAPGWKQGRMGREPLSGLDLDPTGRHTVFRTKSRSRCQHQGRGGRPPQRPGSAQSAALMPRAQGPRRAGGRAGPRPRRLAAKAARPKVEHGIEAARDWAKPRVDHGIEVAAPKLQGAVEGLAPKVDTARDTIVDTLLPRVAEAIAAVAAASAAAKEGASDAADRSSDALSVLKGDAVAKPPPPQAAACCSS